MTSTANLASEAHLKAMGKMFERSEEVQTVSMAKTMRTMSTDRAWHVLHKSNLTNPVLLEVKAAVTKKHHRHLRKRVDPSNPKGYSGVEGARQMLNEMIYEQMLGYDQKITYCVNSYSSLCVEMEMDRGEIQSANYIAANARELILDSQATINKCEVAIPTLKQQLEDHHKQCEEDIAEMQAELKMIEEDIEVMTTILQMTTCKNLLQYQKELRPMRCMNQCTHRSFITFNHEGLHKMISKMKSTRGQKLLHDGLADLMGTEFLQQNGNSTQDPVVTKFNNPPTPRTDVPADPCTDPDAGSPSNAVRTAGQDKCTIGKGPNCDKLQERFLLIQAGIVDQRNALMEDISDMEHHCRETAATITAAIQHKEQELNEAQTSLAAAMEKEANAGESGRTANDHHKELETQLKSAMDACTREYEHYESEICAMKKIRAEVYKIQGSGTADEVYVDCQVSEWDEGECSAECHMRGDEYPQQKLVRSILTHPDKGTKCLPLEEVKHCNMESCPVDCVVSSWSEWSSCTAECGGGDRQRLKEVHTAAAHGGKECGEVQEVVACHTQSCDPDCELEPWTGWSLCSKDCDGGTRHRVRYVETEAKGEGTCPDSKDEERLQYKECNMHACLTEGAHDCSNYHNDHTFYTCISLPTCCQGYIGMGTQDDRAQCMPEHFTHDASYSTTYPTQCGPQSQVMSCDATVDIVLLIDGSGSLGEEGWAAEKHAASMFVDAFSSSTASAKISTILYSGPSSWAGVYSCIGQSSDPVALETVCKIRTVNHMEADMAVVKSNIEGLSWPQGGTLTSMALMKAASELSLGRGHAEAIVVVITDGRPLSYRGTWMASRYVRKMARVMWMAVTENAPLRFIKWCATKRWQENVVVVHDFEELDTPMPINHLIADLCPSHGYEGKGKRQVLG
jgi:hypothetical protein